MNKDYPKISEVIELLSESEPIGTKEDRFARGSNELDVESAYYVGMGCLRIAFIATALVSCTILYLWLR